MKKYGQCMVSIFAVMMMLLCILDFKTAFAGAAEGINLCVTVLIPSLLPFMILATILIRSLRKYTICKLSKILQIPSGAENIFLISLLGGYPIGAQCLSGEYAEGNLSKDDAQRMLAFCNNAGPAFIFGMGSNLFEDSRVCWLIWGIQILSAVLIAWIIPAIGSSSYVPSSYSGTSAEDVLPRCIRSMALVCTWVMIFRMILEFLDRWIFFLLPQQLQILMSGFLELANGCYGLRSISSLPVRFIFFSTMLAFGGCCVSLQTYSVVHTNGLSMRYYFSGKIIQAVISYAISSILASVIWEYSVQPEVLLCIAPILCTAVYRSRKSKKVCSILPPVDV